MWPSNIGWNADSQIGVVSCRQLLKQSYLAAQHLGDAAIILQ